MQIIFIEYKMKILIANNYDAFIQNIFFFKMKCANANDDDDNFGNFLSKIISAK